MAFPKYDFEYNDSERIFYKIPHTGINMEDINKSWDYVFQNNIIKDDCRGMILDMREATFQFGADQYTGIVSFIQKNIDVFRGLKIALVTANAKDIVIPMLIQQHKMDYQFQIFSTIETARAWVLSKVHVPTI